MIFGCTPIGKLTNNFNENLKIIKGYKFKNGNPKLCSDLSADALSHMLDADPKTRITAANLLKHPIFKGIKFPKTF